MKSTLPSELYLEIMKMYKKKSENLNNKNDINILIVYGSKYGSTQDIAERIGKELRENGFLVDCINFNKEKRKKAYNLEKYSGFILGSGIYAGAWTPKIKKFIKKNVSILKQKPIAAFAVCGETHNIERKEIARINYVDKYLAKFGIIPDFGIAFAGVLDLSSTSPYNKLELKIVRLINKKDISVLRYGRNDFRNWENVLQFTKDFAQFFPYITESKFPSKEYNKASLC